MIPHDLREPQRRAGLYEDACEKAVIGGSRADKLMFYAAIARTRRLATLNPCGMLRSIVETTAFRGYIADQDEDQARGWLAAFLPTDPATGNARYLLCRITSVPTQSHQSPENEDGETRQPAFPIDCHQAHVPDAIVVSHLTRRLQKAGFPTHDAFNLIMTTHEGRKHLADWDHKRWDRAATTNERESHTLMPNINFQEKT